MVQGAGRDKERPPVQLLAECRQAFHVEHLTNWHSPTGKAVVVHRPLVVSVRPYLEADL